MKLIVDIPKEIYIEKKEDYIGDTLDRAIANGTPLEVELKKLWLQIYNIEELDHDFEGFYHCQNEALELIDKRIEELKGENNHDCRNCDKWKTCENGEKGHANGTSIGYSIGDCRDYVELKGEK